MSLKLSILVVDDSATIRETFSSELMALGYDVSTVATEEKALQLLDKTQFNLVFIDLVLGQGDGMNILTVIQEKQINTVPIVMTAHQSSETATEAIDRGAYDYVIKPINPGDLEIVIKRALKRHEVEEKKRESFKTRIEQLESFRKNSNELIEEIDCLKKEVNALLVQIGKPRKY